MQFIKLKYPAIALFATAALFVVSVTAVPVEAHKSANGSSIDLATVPHPNVRGLHLNFFWEGTPESSNMTEVYAANVLKSWGAHVTFGFAPGTAIAYADMQHGGTFLWDSMPDVLAGFNTGVNLEAVGMAQPRQDYVFITRPNITSLTQLKGKTIGVLDMQGANGAQAIIVLKKAGLSLSQVTIDAGGGQSERLAELISGRVDGTMLSHAAELTLAGQGYHVLYDYTKQDSTLYDDLCSSPASWVKKHPQAVVALNEADFLSFVAFDNPKSDGAMFKMIAGIDPALTRASTVAYFNLVRSLHMYPPGSVMTAAALQAQESLYKSLDAISATPPLSAWVNLSYQQQALKKLGRLAY